jgi:hypothetical protein
MPEMLQFCGRRLRVRAVAHKACDVARNTLKSRRLESSVFLADARCDGSAHGGCQADCNLFWKDAWLKPAGGDAELPAAVTLTKGQPPKVAITEAELRKTTSRTAESEGSETVYSCQATRLFDATQELAWWNPRQYLRDVVTRNHSLGYASGVLLVAFLKHLRRAPRLRRMTRWLHESVHYRLRGRELPTFRGTIPFGGKTPTGRLDLKPGEEVRIKSKAEIERTLDVAGRNRGMYFDEELAGYCGSVRTVRKSVVQLIDEGTGRMRRTKEPCVMLDGVVCKGEYSSCRLLCPREISSWWREIWLERQTDGVSENTEPTRPA